MYIDRAYNIFSNVYEILQIFDMHLEISQCCLLLFKYLQSVVQDALDNVTVVLIVSHDFLGVDMAESIYAKGECNICNNEATFSTYMSKSVRDLQNLS